MARLDLYVHVFFYFTLSFFIAFPLRFISSTSRNKLLFLSTNALVNVEIDLNLLLYIFIEGKCLIQHYCQNVGCNIKYEDCLEKKNPADLNLCKPHCAFYTFSDKRIVSDDNDQDC
jgi:hypothetical protein